MKAALIAPSAKRSRTRFGIRKATTNASISLPAPNTAASTCSRTSPRIRLVSVAAPARPADRARRSCEAGESFEGAGAGESDAMRLAAAERLSGDLIHQLAVNVLAGEPCHGSLHDTAQVLRGCRAGFSDGVSDRTLDDGGVSGRWAVGVENLDFGGFLVS